MTMPRRMIQRRPSFAHPSLSTSSSSSSSSTSLQSSSSVWNLALLMTSVLFFLVTINTLTMWKLVQDDHHNQQLQHSQELPYWLLSTTVSTDNLSTTTDESLLSNTTTAEYTTPPAPSFLTSRHDNLTFGHAIPTDPDVYYYSSPPPPHTPPDHRWRYRSNNVYWNTTTDPLYLHFHQHVTRMRLSQHSTGAIVPTAVRTYQNKVTMTLLQNNLTKLATLWNNSFPFTLERTTFPLFDGTTYIITGDIELMWLRDSCAQVQPYLRLLGQSEELLALVEGLLRRQALFILLDPYATSFRLFLDFNFKGKMALEEWDYKCGRTVHVAMHNYELDNLAYYLKLSYELFVHYHRQYQESNNTTTTTMTMRALDDTWLQSLDRILEIVEREQNHNASNYTYPELPRNGRGSVVCDGGGLSWSGFRPSDDRTKYGYLIPANQMMVVSLRNVVKILSSMADGNDARLMRVQQLAQSMDEGIHKHGVVDDAEFGPIYAYEVDACGNYKAMDDANIPSLLSLPYLQYTSPHDPNNTIRDNTRRFVLSPKNKFFYRSEDHGLEYVSMGLRLSGVNISTEQQNWNESELTKLGNIPNTSTGNQGIGSEHTKSCYIWHLSLIMQALTSTDDNELRDLLNMLQRTASHDLMHESFHMDRPKRFTRKSFAWANSLFAELISTRLEDIVRIMGNETQRKTKRI